MKGVPTQYWVEPLNKENHLPEHFKLSRDLRQGHSNQFCGLACYVLLATSGRVKYYQAIFYFFYIFYKNTIYGFPSCDI